MARTSRLLIVVLVSLFLSLLDGRLAVPVNCQERAPINGPCSDAMAQRAKGRWIHDKDLLYDMSGAFLNEASRRMDEMHRMLAEIYPAPTGVDAVWHRHKGHVLFADDVTHARGVPVGGYYYSVGFFRYFCDPSNKNRMIGGYPGETGTFFTISANSYFPWEGIADDPWAIDGRPVMRRAPLKQMWKGHPMFRGSNFCTVLIHRNGMLPYIPVTRKQYLDHSIQHLTEIFDTMLVGFRQVPVQQRNDERISKAVQNTKVVLKRYQDELEKTTRERLLDSPAIISQVHSPDTTTPIFVTEAEEGTMLITENPSYFRRDSPKYVPQVLVLGLRWNDWEPQKNLDRIVQENFPVERLEAMLDR